MKVGDLVLCKCNNNRQAIGIIKKKIGIGGSYEVYFFNPPNRLFVESLWPPSHFAS